MIVKQNRRIWLPRNRKGIFAFTPAGKNCECCNCQCISVRFSGFLPGTCSTCSELNSTFIIALQLSSVTPIAWTWKAKMCSELHPLYFCSTFDEVRLTVTDLGSGNWRVQVFLSSNTAGQVVYRKDYSSQPFCREWNNEEIPFASESYNAGCSCSAALSSAFLSYAGAGPCPTMQNCRGPKCDVCEAPEQWSLDLGGFSDNLCDSCSGLNNTFILTRSAPQCQWRYEDFSFGTCDCQVNGARGPAIFGIVLNSSGIGADFVSMTLEIGITAGCITLGGVGMIGAHYTGIMQATGCPGMCNQPLQMTGGGGGNGCNGTFPSTVTLNPA